jgi:outer membrane receptor protein involved in Fe transport
VQWNARIQTPGGSIFVQPAVNAVVGLPSADPLWERDSRTALLIDLTAGLTRGRAAWVLGVRNLNDASWRYHTSLMAFSMDTPMYERGRSFFFRYRRRL